MATALESASLVMVPCGYEDGTLGSLQPTDGTGDFTFTRGSNLSATRVNAAGNIERGYENLLLQSNSFGTTPWALNTTSATSGQTGYDGSNDAWLLNSTGTGFPRIQQNVSISGVFVFSLYAKPATDEFMLLRHSGTSGDVWFNLSDGSTINAVGSDHISATSEDVGGGWYRYSVATKGSLTAVRIYPASAFGVYSTSGNGIYIQDAMLNQGLVTYPYIETTTTSAQGGILEDTPRIDYSSGPNGSLLLEASRSNLIVNSEYFGGYTNSNSTDEANATTSPEGLINATSFLEAATTGQHKLFTSVIFDGSSNYTFSIFAKSNGRDLYVDTQNLNEWGGKAWFDLTAGTANAILGTADIDDFGNGWYRCTVTGASTLSGGNFVELLTSDGSTNSTIGDITKGVYIYGAQVEQASYPTSLIPTYGTSVTRAGEVCGSAGNATTFNDSEGVLYAEIAALADDSTQRFIILGDGTNQNEVRMAFENFGTSIISLRVTVGGTQQAFEWKQFLLPSILNYNKIAIVYAENRFELWVNGAKERSSSSGSTFPSSTLDRLDFKLVSGQHFYGNVKQVVYFPTALSDAALIELTTL